jgi:phosphoglycolate phosphatase-like HAD superfamily hydrolase
LAIAEVGQLLLERTSAEDAAHSKPDPGIIQVALEQLGLPASQAIMIGDTPYDLQAAHKAGVCTIAFRSGGWSDADLVGELAIYDTPADLLAHYDESSIARHH